MKTEKMVEVIEEVIEVFEKGNGRIKPNTLGNLCLVVDELREQIEEIDIKEKMFNMLVEKELLFITHHQTEGIQKVVNPSYPYRAQHFIPVLDLIDFLIDHNINLDLEETPNNENRNRRN